MKKIKFSKTFSFILLFTLFLIFLSYYVNRSTEETLEKISYTYILGLYFFGLGTCLPKLNKLFARILLVIGSCFYMYLFLYYMFGFHNPYWGNWSKQSLEAISVIDRIQMMSACSLELSDCYTRDMLIMISLSISGIKSACFFVVFHPSLYFTYLRIQNESVQ